MPEYKDGVEYTDENVAASDDISIVDDLTVGDDATITGDLGVTGSATVNTHIKTANNRNLQIGAAGELIFTHRTTQTPNAAMALLSTVARHIVLADVGDVSVDFSHAQSSDPTLFIQAADGTDITKYSTVKYNELGVGASNGSFCAMKSMVEAVTISVGNGAAGVETSGNLAPANSLIYGVAVRVTDAPGGGATTLDIGVTGGGNLDQLVDGMSTALNTTGTSAANNDGTQLPIVNGSAATLTLTTDSDVTGDDMIARVAVYYIELTPPTS